MFDVGLVEILMGIFFVIFGVLFVTVVVAIVVTSVRRYRAVKAAGLDPWAADVQLATRAVDGLAAGRGAPASSLEDRLDELNALRDRGVITDEEYAQARRDALAGR